jgi:hypothetical protein
VGQADDRHGLSLPIAIRVHPVFREGQAALNDLGIADIITVPRIHRGYPAEKPSAVSEVLIAQSSQEGDVVADPFMGSASVGIAALKLGRRSWALTSILKPRGWRRAPRAVRRGTGIRPTRNALVEISSTLMGSGR